MAPTARRTAQLAHALSDPTRLEVLRRLRTGERCVCDLMDDLGAAQSRLSFHLKVLKDAGLIRGRRQGRWSYYAIQPDALEALHDAVVALRPRQALPLAPGKCC
jgi:ArsR family transcriptional regulator